MSSFLTEAKGMLDALKSFSGCELHHHKARPMLQGLRVMLNTVDYDLNSVGCLEKQIDALLEEEGIAEAELNSFGLPDPNEWPEDSVLPEDAAIMFGSEYTPEKYCLEGKIGEELNSNELEYKVAEKLGWLDMTVEIAIPAISAILVHYKRRRKICILHLDADHIFGLLLTGDVTCQDWKTFINLRGKIEDLMKSGTDYQSAINAVGNEK